MTPWGKFSRFLWSRTTSHPWAILNIHLLKQNHRAGCTQIHERSEMAPFQAQTSPTCWAPDNRTAAPHNRLCLSWRPTLVLSRLVPPLESHASCFPSPLEPCWVTHWSTTRSELLMLIPGPSSRATLAVHLGLFGDTELMTSRGPSAQQALCFPDDSNELRPLLNAS